MEFDLDSIVKNFFGGNNQLVSIFLDSQSFTKIWNKTHKITMTDVFPSLFSYFPNEPFPPFRSYDYIKICFLLLSISFQRQS